MGATASTRKRVAVINQPMDVLLPPHQNSIGIWTYKVAAHLARRHDVLVIGKRSSVQRAWGGGDGVRYEFVRPLVPNRMTARVLDRVLAGTGGDRLPSYASRATYLDYAVQAGLAARRFGADIVHIHNFSQFVPTVRRLCPQATIVLHMACEWLTQLDRDVIERRLADTDLVIGCSDFITDRVRERFPRHADRCTTVHNGVDIDRFTPGEPAVTVGGNARVLFVGRLSPEKGIHDLLDALPKVLAERPDVALDLAGPAGALPREFIVDISDEAEVVELARFYEGPAYLDQLRARLAPDITDRVRFLGAIPQDELVELYRLADVVANPSYSEAFGMSLIEALACGTPVVASRVGGMVDIVGDDGTVGLLHDRGDVDQLAAGLLELLDRRDDRPATVDACRSRAVEHFGWVRIAESLAEAYDGVGRR
ncbi:MAG: glycosyltransferase family 4 protein [Actinomycetota bacterium]